jgi:putative ABC transport system ATP-binding protein
LIDGQHTGSYNDKKLSRLRNEKIGFIFQSFHLIPDLNVLDNVEVPLLYRPGVSGKERRRRAKEALGRVELTSRLKHYPSQLSGGQRQRVAIARAISGKPEIILADEPTGNLDSKMGAEVMAILQELNGEGTTIVMVTHEERLAKLTNRTIRLFDGERVD